MEDLFWIGHSSFYAKSKNGTTIFIDPFEISNKVKEKADLILITHPHFDHCSKNDISKIIKEDTEIIAAQGCISGEDFKNITVAFPGFSKAVKGIEITAIPAYNNKKERLAFHPKENKWVGYVFGVNGKKIYHAGDTDFIDEMSDLKEEGIDIAILPIGGKYTMDVEEAIIASRAINARETIPMHYKHLLGIEGSEKAEEKFKKTVKGGVVLKEIQEPNYKKF